MNDSKRPVDNISLHISNWDDHSTAMRATVLSFAISQMAVFVAVLVLDESK